MAKVLVAEDDHLMRWSLEKFLTQHGHLVHSVGSGSAAIDASKSGECRVVITDYVMPGRDGLEVLQEIKRRVPHTHVILITGNVTPHMERFARDRGAFDFFEKPFNLATLKHAVERAIVTPERRKGPRCCRDGCEWQALCDGARSPQSPRPFI